MKNDKETRLLEFELNSEFRAEEQDGKMILEGYPIVFDQETMIGDEDWGWKEIIDRHALDNADMKDCCLKYNHGDTKGILARVRNGSLKLTIEPKGVFMHAELIDTQDCKDIYKCVKAKLLDKMSFAFTIDAQEIDDSVKPRVRRITKIKKLFDVAVVDIPAYSQTSIYARSRELLEESLRGKAEAENEPVVETTERDNLALTKLKIKIKLGLEE